MRRPSLSWIVLFASLSLTVIATWAVARSVKERDNLRFDNAVQTAHDRIRTRMETYLALLRSGAGFFAATEGRVTYDQFRAYAERIDIRAQYRGIQGIGYSLRVRPGMRDSVVASMQDQGATGFHIWPAAVAAQERHTIVYLEPLDVRNQSAIGYDMYQQETRREAMARAWAEGEPAMSGIVELVQEISGPKQNGFLIYVPVYRSGTIPNSAAARQELLTGFIYAPFRAGDLFEGIFGTERNPRVAFRIYDGLEENEDRLLFASDSIGLRPVAPAAFSDTTRLDLANRPWTIRFTQTEHFIGGVQRSLVPIIAIAGLAVSLILFALVRVQIGAESVVRRSEQKLRATLESLPVGVFVADPDGEISFTNTAVRRIWRHDSEEPIDRERFRGWWPESGTELRREEWGLWRALNGQTVGGQVIETETFDGERRIILNSAFPVRSQSGKLEMAVAVVIDITEQKRAEAALRERNREFSLMANSIPQLAWMADERGSMFWFNDRWYAYTGLKPEQVMGWGWTTLHHPDHASRVMGRLKEAFDEGREWEDTFPLRGADGEYRWFLSRAVPFRDDAGRVVRWFGTHTDITDQIHARETEARAMREQAAREAAEAREGELRALTQELERSNRELQDFAYVASHDLQEPLRKIATFSELLQDELSDQISEQGQHYLKRMEHAAHRMSRLIRDLLTFSRVSTRPEAIEEVNLNEAVSDVILDLEWRIRESNGRVDVGELGTIEADPMQMRQLLQNLIGNALKFHRPGAAPEVRVEGHYELPGSDGNHTDGIYQLEVSDNGIGFDQKYIDRIFTPFQRLHGRDHYEGTGMGLAISRRIVERHGGSITARSAPGEGSRFIVRMPVTNPRRLAAGDVLKEHDT